MNIYLIFHYDQLLSAYDNLKSAKQVIEQLVDDSVMLSRVVSSIDKEEEIKETRELIEKEYRIIVMELKH